MRRIFTGTFLSACLLCLAAAQDSADELKLNQLLERYTESYGGLRDANRLASISIEGEQIQGGVAYSFQLRKKRPDLMHYQLEKGNTTLTTIYNGRKAWLRVQRGEAVSVEELTGSQLEAVKKEARFESPLYRHLDKPENKITLEGRERVGGLRAFVLRVETSGDSSSLYYLHPEHSWVLRIDHLDEAGERASQTLYRDYREVDGYPFARKVENRTGGDTVAVTRVDSVSVNPGLMSFYFEEPQE